MAELPKEIVPIGVLGLLFLLGAWPAARRRKAIRFFRGRAWPLVAIQFSRKGGGPHALRSQGQKVEQQRKNSRFLKTIVTAQHLPLR
jgi:hypothetical protein